MTPGTRRQRAGAGEAAGQAGGEQNKMEKKAFVTRELVEEIAKTYPTPFISMMRGGFVRMPEL